MAGDILETGFLCQFSNNPLVDRILGFELADFFVAHAAEPDRIANAVGVGIDAVFIKRLHQLAERRAPFGLKIGRIIVRYIGWVRPSTRRSVDCAKRCQRIVCLVVIPALECWNSGWHESSRRILWAWMPAIRAGMTPPRELGGRTRQIGI